MNSWKTRKQKTCINPKVSFLFVSSLFVLPFVPLLPLHPPSSLPLVFVPRGRVLCLVLKQNSLWQRPTFRSPSFINFFLLSRQVFFFLKPPVPLCFPRAAPSFPHLPTSPFNPFIPLNFPQTHSLSLIPFQQTTHPSTHASSIPSHPHHYRTPCSPSPCLHRPLLEEPSPTTL